MSPVERQAFTDRILPKLHAIARRLQVSPCFDRDDLVQEACLRLLAILDETGEEPGEWYVHQVGKGAMLDFLRKWSRDSRHEELSVEAPAEVVCIDTAIDVRRALRMLPARERKVLTMHASGHTQREIARELQVSRGRVPELRQQALRRFDLKEAA